MVVLHTFLERRAGNANATRRDKISGSGGQIFSAGLPATFLQDQFSLLLSGRSHAAYLFETGNDRVQFDRLSAMPQE